MLLFKAVTTIWAARKHFIDFISSTKCHHSSSIASLIYIIYQTKVSILVYTCCYVDWILFTPGSRKDTLLFLSCDKLGANNDKKLWVPFHCKVAATWKLSYCPIKRRQLGWDHNQTYDSIQFGSPPGSGYLNDWVTNPKEEVRGL